MARGQEAMSGRGKFFELARGENPVLGRQILLGEIDLGLDAREEAEQRVDEFLHVPAERAAELLVRDGQGPLAARMDEIHHGLGLAEIHPAV